MSIRVTGLSKSFGAQKALDGVSFSIEKGEVVGFLGPNGAGKSTLMKILTTYYQADAGTAEVGGADVAQQAGAVQRSLGYLPEPLSALSHFHYAGRLADVDDGLPKRE